MWKSAYVGFYQLLNWKVHGETLKFVVTLFTKAGLCGRFEYAT